MEDQVSCASFQCLTITDAVLSLDTKPVIIAFNQVGDSEGGYIEACLAGSGPVGHPVLQLNDVMRDRGATIPNTCAPGNGDLLTQNLINSHWTSWNAWNSDVTLRHDR